MNARSVVAESAFRAAAERDGVQIVGQYVNGNTPVACVCPTGHDCAPRPGYIRKGGGWCRVCSGLDSAAADSAFRAAANQANVRVVGRYVNARTPVVCVCPNGHECAPRPGHTQRGTGWCKTCAGLDSAIAETAFHTSAFGAGVKVVGRYVNSGTPVECVCPSGHPCAPRPNGIQQGSGWCRVCAGKDFTTAETAFVAAAERDGVRVVGRYVNAQTPVECVCPNGHECAPWPSSIRKGCGWCKECLAAFDRLYVVLREVDGQVWAKYGIASGPARVRVHKGWHLARQWSGEHAAVVATEREVKALAKAWPKLSRATKPDGHTETFPWLEHGERVVTLIEDRLHS